MTVMLETKNLGISFGGLKAVDGLDLKINDRPQRSRQDNRVQFVDGSI